MHAAWIHNFQAFYDYVSQLENFGRAGYTLDRIDNDGDYEPGNLRFATPAEQNRNTSRNIKIVYNGVEMCLMDTAIKSGIPHKTLFTRYYRGDRGERLFRPVRQKG